MDNVVTLGSFVFRALFFWTIVLPLGIDPLARLIGL